MRRILIVVFLFIVAFLIYPYVRVEILTYSYGNQFANLPRDPAWSGELVYLKVLEYSDTEAEVYMVEHVVDLNKKKYKVGTKYTFSRSNIRIPWKMKTFNTIWSESGSADQWMYPYYH